MAVIDRCFAVAVPYTSLTEMDSNKDRDFLLFNMRQTAQVNKPVVIVITQRWTWIDLLDEPFYLQFVSIGMHYSS